MFLRISFGLRRVFIPLTQMSPDDGFDSVTSFANNRKQYAQLYLIGLLFFFLNQRPLVGPLTSLLWTSGFSPMGSYVFAHLYVMAQRAISEGHTSLMVNMADW